MAAVRAVVSALLIVAAATTVGCGYGFMATTPSPSTTSPSLTIADIAHIGSAATVYITRSWVNSSPLCPDSAGSGIYLGNDQVLTAAHVLWEWKFNDPCFPPSTKVDPQDPFASLVSIPDSIIRVRNSSGSTNVARLIWYDASTDLALLSVPNQSRTTALAWGDSNALRIGDTVVAVGYPVTGVTVTRGIVSDLVAKQIPALPGRRPILIDLIQTDAAVNPGNSGGPLLNDRGELIGIVDFRVEGGNYGLGFAVASSTARRVVDSGGRLIR